MSSIRLVKKVPRPPTQTLSQFTIKGRPQSFVQSVSHLPKEEVSSPDPQEEEAIEWRIGPSQPTKFLDKMLENWADEGISDKTDQNTVYDGYTAQRHCPLPPEVSIQIEQQRNSTLFYNLARLPLQEGNEAFTSVLYNDDDRYFLSLLSYILHPSDSSHLLNRTNIYGLSPLACACRTGHLPMVKFLVQKRAQISSKDTKNARNEGINSNGANGAVRKGFRKMRKNESPLEIAARWNNLDVVEYLVTLPEVVACQSDVRKALKCAASEPIRKILEDKLEASCYSQCTLV